MVRRALVPGALAVPVAGLIAFSLGGVTAAVSAALGVAVVVANFAAHGLSLAWAAGVSLVAVQAVALGGAAVRIGTIVALMFGLNRLDWFSPLAFGLAAVPGTFLLLAYEVKVVLGGVGTMLEVPPDAGDSRATEGSAVRA